VAQRAHDRDAYGRPLPEVTDAYREVLSTRPVNIRHRRRITAMLEDLYGALLRRDIHAEVTVRFKVESGMIQTEIETEVIRHYRAVVEE
jgi:hypothetical protein